MKALELLKMYQYADNQLQGLMSEELNEAIEEIETLQQEVKQGQDNYNKLWDLYSELKRENKELEEYINETKDCMYCKEAKAIKIYDERNNK